jgi:hypothetical protein
MTYNLGRREYVFLTNAKAKEQEIYTHTSPGVEKRLDIVGDSTVLEVVASPDLHCTVAWKEPVLAHARSGHQLGTSFFFPLEYAKDLRIIVLRRRV